jgi:hypothetical protein
MAHDRADRAGSEAAGILGLRQRGHYDARCARECVQTSAGTLPARHPNSHGRRYRAAARVVPAAPLPDAAIDISQHAPRSVREDAVIVIDVPNINGTENDQKSYEHSHFISLFAAFSPISTGRAAWL